MDTRRAPARGSSALLDAVLRVMAPIATALGLLQCTAAERADAAREAGSDEAAAGADAGGPCDHYFGASIMRCGGPLLPASELRRIRARFEELCQNQIALPGSGVTTASLEACASALDVSPCELPAGPPVECSFHGSLPGGTPCNEDFQCASGICRGTAFLSPDGQIGPTTCGACAPAATVSIGQVCAQGTFSASCPEGAACILSDSTSAMPAYACVATTTGNVGAGCDDLLARCKTGLYCSTQTHQCAVLGAKGAPCGEGPNAPGNPGGCAPPLSCVGNPGSATCDIASEGAFCLSDDDCSPGLGCIPGPCSTTARIGCSASGTCMPVAWAAPGQPCDLFLTRCLVGSCDASVFVAKDGDGGVPLGTCPTVLSDGQSCSVNGIFGGSSGCDTYAECFQPSGLDAGQTTPGTCVLLDSIACR